VTVPTASLRSLLGADHWKWDKGDPSWRAEPRPNGPHGSVVATPTASLRSLHSVTNQFPSEDFSPV